MAVGSKTANCILRLLTFLIITFLVFFVSNMSMNCPELPRIRRKHYEMALWHSYSRIISLVENIGVEPMTSCVQGRRSSQLS